MSNNLVTDITLKQKNLLETFFRNFNHEEIDNLADTILDINPLSKIIFYGIGKSENIAKHIADILSSISIPSICLSPQNCLHGDIGFISKQDYVIYFSNSGNTMELLNIAPYIKKKANYIIGVFTNENAKLIQYCHQTIILPKCEELDPFKTIPSTSVLEYILFGNILSTTLLHKKNMTIEEYSINHPEGSIGRKIYLKAKDIMIPINDVPFITDKTNIHDALFAICEKRLRCAIVTRKDKFIGIITDGNIRRYLSKQKKNIDFFKKSIINCINKNPYTINDTDKVYDIIEAIKNNYRLLSGIPVLNSDKEIIGLVSQEQIVKYGI